MTSSLHRTLDLGLRSADWPVAQLLYGPMMALAEVLIYCLVLQLLMRFASHLKMILAGENALSGVVIDSGASIHTCPDRAKLSNYKPFYFPYPIQGVGGITWALGRGDMELTTMVKNGTNTTRQEVMHLQNVIYLPTSGPALLSTEQLRLQKIFYSSEKAVLYRKHGDSDVVIGETEVVGRGSLELKTVREEPETPLTLSSRQSWYHILQDWGLLPSWPPRFLSASRPTHEEVGRIVSRLEMENDKLLREIDSLKQTIPGRECLSFSQLKSNTPDEEDLRALRRYSTAKRGFEKEQ